MRGLIATFGGHRHPEVRAPTWGEPRRVVSGGACSPSFETPRKSAAPQDDGCMYGCRALSFSLMGPSPPIKDDAGDDKHCRHRQHLRKRFRGRPLGGFLHAVLPRLGRDSSLRENAQTTAMVYSEHPATSIRLDLSPHSANIDRAKVEQ